MREILWLVLLDRLGETKIKVKRVCWVN